MLKFELNVVYDTDLSSIYFDDFKNENNLILADHVCIIFNNGSKNEPYFKKSKLAKMKKDDLQELAENLDIIFCGEEKTKAELINDLMQLDNEDFYKKALENNCLPQKDFTICGYSQGDFVKVWQVGGSEYSAEYLSNLFFDCPIRAVLTIWEIEENALLHNAKIKEIGEWYLDELLSNNYNYNLNEILINFNLHDKKAYADLEEKYKFDLEQEIKNYLEKNLPQDPEYL
jgi:hypothetical protein|nr:MAG TPA: hypothetical protein [Caudoviricetes sp.]